MIRNYINLSESYRPKTVRGIPTTVVKGGLIKRHKKTAHGIP